jgi:hypothetical protein
MSFFLGPLILIGLGSVIALSQRRPELWFPGVLAGTAVVFLVAETAWFGGLMTGVIRLDWLVHWLGTPKLEAPWDTVAFFGPALIVAVGYFVYEMSRRREAIR